MLCACPPAGTDSRHKKCVFPKPPRYAGDKGPRDEVDVIALLEGQLLLIEAKPHLSWATGKPNVAGETDVDKLRRIRGYGLSRLQSLMQRGFGLNEPVKRVRTGLAYEVADSVLPHDMFGIHCPGEHSIHIIGRLNSGTTTD